MGFFVLGFLINWFNESISISQVFNKSRLHTFGIGFIFLVLCSFVMSIGWITQGLYYFSKGYGFTPVLFYPILFTLSKKSKTKLLMNFFYIEDYIYPEKMFKETKWVISKTEFYETTTYDILFSETESIMSKEMAMNIIINFLVVVPMLLIYYILKIYYNHKMRWVLISVNSLTIACLLIAALFIGNQELFEHLFALECVNILIWIYYLLDKSNYKLYSILAKTKAIPIVLGGNWFRKGKKEIHNVIEFLNSNIILMNKNKDINIILLDRNEKTTDLSFIFSKKADIDFYKDKIISNSLYKLNSKGKLLMASFERNW